MVSFAAMCATIASTLLLVVAELGQRLGDRLVGDLEQTAADEALVLDQRDVGLDARGVAVHQERDGAGGREHRDLAVAEAVLLAGLDGLVPRGAGARIRS
jgi:hypothetical protein